MSNFEAFLRFARYLDERFLVRKAQYDGISDVAFFEVRIGVHTVAWPTSLSVLQDESVYEYVAESITRKAAGS